MRCGFCWTEFDEPVALLEHEALEDDRLYFVDQPPSKYVDTMWVE